MSVPLTLDEQALAIAANFFMATSNDCVTLTSRIKEHATNARLVELDLLEQAINQGWDMNRYKLHRLKELTGKAVK
jgi:hypothetical protein